MASSTNFCILRKPTADILSVTMYEPNSPEYTYVVSAINIGLSMLETPQARNSLTELALLFDSTGVGNVVHFGSDAARARGAVDLFLRKLRMEFPMVIIDHCLDNLNVLGCHKRIAWNGTLNDFDPRKHGIYINAQRVSDMVASAGPGGQPFRDFQFLFATTFLHEVGGHLLVTYLSNNRPDTPPSIGGNLGYSRRGQGESGRWLELNLLGGTTEWYRGPSQNMRHTGIPHQINGQNQAWRIDPRVVNSVTSYSFSFPFARTGRPGDPGRFQSMGHNSSDSPANDGERRMMAQQTIWTRQLGRPTGYRVRLQDVRAVANNPRIRLRAY